VWISNINHSSQNHAIHPRTDKKCNNTLPLCRQKGKRFKMTNDMRHLSLRFAALMAAMMMMTMTMAANQWSSENRAKLASAMSSRDRGRAVLKTQDWGGRVIDENGEPMSNVNVVLLSLPDSAFVQGAMTDMDGVFKIVTDVNAGLFKVSCVGYINARM
jgi:hypothetical protein